MVLRRLLSSAVVLACCFSASFAYAQDASVIGTVTDETKSVLPGATVTATNVETGRQTTGVTDDRGSYRLLRMPPGKYKVQAELQGFTMVSIMERFLSTEPPARQRAIMEEKEATLPACSGNWAAMSFLLDLSGGGMRA